MSVQSFTISVGDRFVSSWPDHTTVAEYVVLSVAANGTVLAANVDTGKQRTFPGYGRMLTPDECRQSDINKRRI